MPRRNRYTQRTAPAQAQPAPKRKQVQVLDPTQPGYQYIIPKEQHRRDGRNVFGDFGEGLE